MQNWKMPGILLKCIEFGSSSKQATQNKTYENGIESAWNSSKECAVLAKLLKSS